MDFNFAAFVTAIHFAYHTVVLTCLSFAVVLSGPYRITPIDIATYVDGTLFDSLTWILFLVFAWIVNIAETITTSVYAQYYVDGEKTLEKAAVERWPLFKYCVFYWAQDAVFATAVAWYLAAPWYALRYYTEAVVQISAIWLIPVVLWPVLVTHFATAMHVHLRYGTRSKKQVVMGSENVPLVEKERSRHRTRF